MSTWKNTVRKRAWEQAYFQRRKNTPEYRAYAREHKRKYQARRRAEDPGYRLKHRLQSRIRKALGGVTRKALATMALIGCSVEELRAYIEAQFREGMSWENMHLWHIDHIKPVASFDLSDFAQQQECFHYTNLQPLWAEENRRKGSRCA